MYTQHCGAVLFLQSSLALWCAFLGFKLHPEDSQQAVSRTWNERRFPDETDEGRDGARSGPCERGVS